MDNGVCAVLRGTDLRQHAHLLHRVHDAAMSGSALPATPRDLVLRSWQRVQAYGVSPDPRPHIEPARPEVIEHRRESSPLSRVIGELRASLTAITDDVEHVMVVVDADGMVLWREGDLRVVQHADRLGFVEGALWTESAVGTNGIGTALSEAAPVQLFSAEHFVRDQHPWVCTACPLHDPRTGELLGVVDISGAAATVHPAMVALVRTAARLAESGLCNRHEARMEALRAVAAPVLSRTIGPAVVADDHGWVVAATGTAVSERVAVPVEGEPMDVHGVGVCVPEHLPGGWLLRPMRHGAVSHRLRLDLESQTPHAVVESIDVWRYPLTPRHAQLLALLIGAGQAGLSGAALSVALYGDMTHLVTVRAEISRLRRRLGGLLLARPYRIAPTVLVEPCDPVALQRAGLWGWPGDIAPGA